MDDLEASGHPVAGAKIKALPMGISWGFNRDLEGFIGIYGRFIVDL